MSTTAGDQRRIEILDAVLQVIIDVGFTEMTVADVARVAGVSNALVHYHFSSKPELIAAALHAASNEDKMFRDEIVAMRWHGDGTSGRRAVQVAAGRRARTRRGCSGSRPGARPAATRRSGR